MQKTFRRILALAAVACLAAFAMPASAALTEQQVTALKAAGTADPTAAAGSLSLSLFHEHSQNQRGHHGDDFRRCRR